MPAHLQKFPTGGRFGSAQVRRITSLTPHMIRITLAGDLVRTFAPDSAGGHFKLVVPDRHETPDAYRSVIESGDFKPAMRTYTIRHVRPDQGELDVDIVIHGDCGRVGPWARRTRVGDTIVISRCGSPKLVTTGITRVLAAADMAGFPALAAGLETVPGHVRVDAHVVIPHAKDRQAVVMPGGAQIDWIVQADIRASSDALAIAVRASVKPDEQTSVFVAGEFSMVAALRRHFREETGFDKSRFYISSYWKAGLDEPAHKIAKARAAA